MTILNSYGLETTHENVFREYRDTLYNNTVGPYYYNNEKYVLSQKQKNLCASVIFYV